MAVEIGTATNYSDLLDKLVTFASAEGWTVLENSADKVVLQGVGAGSDEIVVAIQKYADSGADAYGWYLNGYTGYSSGLTFVQQPGALQMFATPGVPALPLWNSSIPYWFLVSDRRIIVVAKVSTTFQMAYLGWYLPFASPNAYPYPMMIGGGAQATSGAPRPRWSTSSACSAFWTGAAPINLAVLMPGGTWAQTTNQQVTSSSVPAGNYETGIFPFNQTFLNPVGSWQPPLGGDAAVTPLLWLTGSSGSAVRGTYGEIDGVFHISGSGRGSEDVVLVDGVDYLVVQDGARTTVASYVAVRLN